MEHTKEEYESLIKECCSKLEFSKRLGYKFYNGTVSRTINQIIQDYSLSIAHFDGGKSKQIKYKTIEKDCPVCGNKFKAQEGHKREKRTCSYACSNKHFRSGENNGMWRDAENVGSKRYARICFKYHKKKCLICGEDKIVAAHHFDHNHNNNDPANLVPLCPTHHQYVHSKHHYLVKTEIENYVENFKKTFSG